MLLALGWSGSVLRNYTGGAPKHSTQLAPVADGLLDLLVGSILPAKFLLSCVEVLD